MIDYHSYIVVSLFVPLHFDVLTMSEIVFNHMNWSKAESNIIRCRESRFMFLIDSGFLNFFYVFDLYNFAEHVDVLVWASNLYLSFIFTEYI